MKKNVKFSIYFLICIVVYFTLSIGILSIPSEFLLCDYEITGFDSGAKLGSFIGLSGIMIAIFSSLYQEYKRTPDITIITDELNFYETLQSLFKMLIDSITPLIQGGGLIYNDGRPDAIRSYQIFVDLEAFYKENEYLDTEKCTKGFPLLFEKMNRFYLGSIPIFNEYISSNIPPGLTETDDAFYDWVESDYLGEDYTDSYYDYSKPEDRIKFKTDIFTMEKKINNAFAAKKAERNKIYTDRTK